MKRIVIAHLAHVPGKNGVPDGSKLVAVELDQFLGYAGSTSELTRVVIPTTWKEFPERLSPKAIGNYDGLLVLCEGTNLGYGYKEHVKLALRGEDTEGNQLPRNLVPQLHHGYSHDIDDRRGIPDDVLQHLDDIGRSGKLIAPPLAELAYYYALAWKEAQKNEQDPRKVSLIVLPNRALWESKRAEEKGDSSNDKYVQLMSVILYGTLMRNGWLDQEALPIDYG